MLGFNMQILEPIKEASLGNIPTIAFCYTDSPMGYVDIGIPANNKGKHWMFVLAVSKAGTSNAGFPQGHKWDAMVDMFFCKEPEEAKQQKEEETVPVVDYALPSTDFRLPSTDWTMPDSQWAANVGLVVLATNLYPEQGDITREWDDVAQPQQFALAATPTSWDE